MAVTLTQMSNDIFARQRASTVPSHLRVYNPSELAPISMQEPHHYSARMTRNHDHGQYSFLQSAPPTYLPQAPQQSHMDSSYHISIPSAAPPSPSCRSPPYASYQQSPNYYHSPSRHNQQSQHYYNSPLRYNQHSPNYYHPSSGYNRHPPPWAQQDPNSASSSDPSSPQLSTNSRSGGSSSSFSRSSIEPDPLPPHSNPQALSESQSHAYFNSQRLPALRIGIFEVWNSQTGMTDFRITRGDNKMMPMFISTKPRLNIIKTSSGLSMGAIRFHTISSNKIELTLNGRETFISHTGFVHNRWGFKSTTCPDTEETWYWKKDKETGGAMLEDAKRSGHVLARMKGDLLTFVKARLSQESHEEIVMSAIAMAEAARRQKRKSDIVDIASAIGDFASSDGRHAIEGVGS